MRRGVLLIGLGPLLLLLAGCGSATSTGLPAPGDLPTGTTWADYLGPHAVGSSCTLSAIDPPANPTALLSLRRTVVSNDGTNLVEDDRDVSRDATRDARHAFTNEPDATFVAHASPPVMAGLYRVSYAGDLVNPSVADLRAGRSVESKRTVTFTETDSGEVVGTISLTSSVGPLQTSPLSVRGLTYSDLVGYLLSERVVTTSGVQPDAEQAVDALADVLRSEEVGYTYARGIGLVDETVRTDEGTQDLRLSSCSR